MQNSDAFFASRAKSRLDKSHCSKMKMNGQTTEWMPLPLSMASRNFPDVKTRNNQKKNIGPVHLLTQLDEWDYL